MRNSTTRIFKETINLVMYVNIRLIRNLYRIPALLKNCSTESRRERVPPDDGSSATQLSMLSPPLTLLPGSCDVPLLSKARSKVLSGAGE
mmetsp:Transcript_11767/g.40629  ORF Transcript_11767/g.40629 Transcript_11767/m.40629 type:complete len:90 (-) Transcript_11767:122-391(-)